MSCRTGGMYLGAVGAYDWSGTVVKYDSSNDQTPDITTFDQISKVLKNRTKVSYLGYAITSGFYLGGETEYVAVGAPINQLFGAVVIYRPRLNNPNFTSSSTIYPHDKKDVRQLGSYFGGVLMSTDVNGDKKDDLFVGAPLYTASSYDEGRVFVYLSSEQNNIIWAEESYIPTILKGGVNDEGGRFGTAMAPAGDLNNDGYKDVIIGAPYLDNNKGAIFVFHGSENGIDTNPKQVIRASSFPNDNFQYFGLSIAGEQDLDGNGYPDIVVGAPKSDAVIMFRSRPVAEFTGKIQYSIKEIDISSCLSIPQRNCTAIEACIEINGEQIEDQIPVNFKIALDTLVTGKKRVEFREAGEKAAGTNLIEKTLNLETGREECFQYTVFVKNQISDYSTPIKTVLTYKMSDEHIQQPLSSIRDPTTSNEETAEAQFLRNCGRDNICNYNLVVGGEMKLPEATLQLNPTQTVDLTDSGKILIVSEQTSTSPIRFSVNVSNTGETAFDVRVSIYFNNFLTWQSLGNFASSVPNNPVCMLDNQLGGSGDPYNTKTLIYRYNQALGNIMERLTWCYFEFNMSFSDLSRSGAQEKMNITVFAHTRGNIQKDLTDENQKVTETAQIRYRADAIVTEFPIVTTVPFNFTNETTTVFSVKHIGQADIEMDYEIANSGHSTIPQSSVEFVYPYNLPNQENYESPFHLLYPYAYECTSQTGTATCDCDTSALNPYGLLDIFPPTNTSGLPNVTVAPYPTKTNVSVVYNCSDPNAAPTGMCQRFKCNISNLASSETLRFQLTFRLWSQSFNIDNTTDLGFVSRFTYSTADSKLLINNANKRTTTLSSTILTKANLFSDKEQQEVSNNIWIYIVAAIGGLLLLILIIIVLWKTGFFKSKYAEKKEALAWQDANTES